MRHVSIPVHPLTKRVLLSEFGAEPIILPNHDFIFKMLTGSDIRARQQRHLNKLTAQVSFLLDERFARHVEQYGRSIGAALMAYHFQVLCRFADSALQIKGKGHVKAAIEGWLYMYGIDENEYPADNAYKLWQRHGWSLKEKNPHFFGRSRDISAGITSKKMRLRASRPEPLRPMVMLKSEIEVELAVARFVAAVCACFRRPPKKLAQHARIYYYVNLSGLSCRDVEAKLGIPKSSVCYACQSIAYRAQANRTFALMLAESANSALPQPA